MIGQDPAEHGRNADATGDLRDMPEAASGSGVHANVNGTSAPAARFAREAGAKASQKPDGTNDHRLSRLGLAAGEVAFARKWGLLRDRNGAARARKNLWD